MPPTLAIPVTILHGTPYQRGFQHGAAHAVAIQTAVSRWRDDLGGRAYDMARPLAVRSWSLVRSHAPDVAAELTGIAEASSSDLIDLYLRVGFEFLAEPSPTGCSGIAVTGCDGAIVGQNWDAPPGVGANLVLFLHLGSNGVEQAIVASVGMLGWVGCNGSGLALLTNDLILDTALQGLPSQVVRRLVLAQPNVPAALAVLRALPHMGGRCYLIGDAEGRIAGVELSPRAGVRTMQPASPIIHTNHARLPQTSAVEDEPQLAAAYPSSRKRLATLAGLAEGVSTAIDMMQVLRSRGGAPNAISKTVSAEEATETAFSIIVDCAAREFHLCAGPPSLGVYSPFRLPDPIGVPGTSWTPQNPQNAIGDATFETAPRRPAGAHEEENHR